MGSVRPTRRRPHVGPEDAVEPLVRRLKDTLDSMFLFSIITHGKGMSTPNLEDSSAH